MWTQHGYIGGVNPVDDVERALQRKGCAQPALWITETGVGAPHSGEKPRKSPAAQVAACKRLHRRLVQWYRDDRVTAAFQYTFREDDLFPTGLVKTDLWARSQPSPNGRRGAGPRARRPPTPAAGELRVVARAGAAGGHRPPDGSYLCRRPVPPALRL